jgi:uncharacterized phage-associated protein
MEHALDLAAWVRSHAAARGRVLTHLSLQKLCFYGYGAAAALDLEAALGTVRFEAWKHGPVCPVVYEAYKEHKGEPLPPFDGTRPNYPQPVCDALLDALDVYGAMSAYSLRDESHLEQPWIDASPQAAEILPAALKAHFKAKFAPGRVRLPAHLSGQWSAALDSIPSATFPSLADIAASLREPPTSTH